MMRCCVSQVHQKDSSCDAHKAASQIECEFNASEEPSPRCTNKSKEQQL